MEFIEEYKNLFDLVADLPEDDPCGSYTSLMRPVELKATPETKKFDGGDEDDPASASFIETEEKQNFKECLTPDLLCPGEQIQLF